MSQDQTQIERSALLPEWQAGYYNQTIRGIGADDVSYNAGTRFQAFQIGLAMPLVSKAQRRKVRASEKRTLAAEIALEQRKKELETALESAWTRYRIKSEALDSFEKGQNADAQKMTEVAGLLFDKGEIQYLEYSLLIQQSLQIRKDYLDAIRELNHEIILIHYLTSK
jgi:cobalt-zinc-cadmium resistance protein CzcA